MNPKVTISVDKLAHNAQTVYAWCRACGIEPAFVGKCVCEDKRVLQTVMDCGYRIVADSREENLATIDGSLQKMLLRIGMPERADEIVQVSDISLQSELTTLKALEHSAGKLKKKHKVILMVDLGDLREGIFYKDREKILEAATFVHESASLLLFGIGTNLTCYGSVVPDEKNLGELVDITREIENRLHITIPYIAGGNSSSLHLLRNGGIPEGINLLRIGEAILLGTDTYDGTHFPELFDDAFILDTTLVEIQEKPSYPIGTLSVNAFGQTVEYHDKGIMKRGILAIGEQDVPSDGLIPLDRNISVVGASSDHLIVDLSGADAPKVGDTVSFKLTYGGLLRCYTSRYINKALAD